jgi:hypothetical protein
MPCLAIPFHSMSCIYFPFHAMPRLVMTCLALP